jgi:hypothetical protein
LALAAFGSLPSICLLVQFKPPRLLVDHASEHLGPTVLIVIQQTGLRALVQMVNGFRTVTLRDHSQGDMIVVRQASGRIVSACRIVFIDRYARVEREGMRRQPVFRLLEFSVRFADPFQALLAIT